MAQKTSGEIEKEFIDGLKSSTGKDLKTWMSAIDGFGETKRNDIIKVLKETHGFGHMNASLLVGLYANGGKPVYASQDDLLENQFAKATDMRPLYDDLIAFVQKNFPGTTILPKKTYVSVVDNREFGAINIKRAELRIGFDLGDRPFDEKVEKAKLTGPMPRISHMVVITDAGDIGNSIVELLRASHARCH
ncbi:MAG: DUF5655 domain-containing protein [Pyrinomonadaceae bacterium]